MIGLRALAPGHREPGGRRLGDEGHAAVELILVVGLLLLPATAFLATIPVWVERQAAARDAAAAAARTAVIVRSDSVVARAIGATEQGWGLDPGALSWTTAGQPADRGETFTVEVTVELPTIEIPVLGSIGGIDWSTSHTEPTPGHRSR